RPGSGKSGRSGNRRRGRAVGLSRSWVGPPAGILVVATTELSIMRVRPAGWRAGIAVWSSEGWSSLPPPFRAQLLVQDAPLRPAPSVQCDHAPGGLLGHVVQGRGIDPGDVRAE